MCTGAEAAVLAGTAAQQYGDSQTRRDQQHEAQRREEQANQLNAKAGARVSQQVNDLKQSTADAGATDQMKLQNEFMDALRKSQIAGGGSGLDATPGNVSDQYGADAAAARMTNASGNRMAATNLARIDAPFMQRVRENTGASRTVSDLSRIENEGKGQDYLAQLRASLISPNAGLDAVGQFGVGYGTAAAQRAPVKRPKLLDQLPDQTPNYGAVA